MSKPDCKLGWGNNANMLISEIYKKGPEYLSMVYNTYNLTEDVKEVIGHYLNIDIKEIPNKKDKVLKTKKENKAMAKIKENNENLESKGLLSKINLIRKAWSESIIEKDGKGKAGGGSKYDYYKPQQIIEFCLAQELKHELFSEFKIEEGMCYYNVLDIPTGEIRSTNCPFEIPRKMAASEAQQVGAAMTYHNRRLAMMMYKIEDNSKENVQVLGDADFSMPNIPAPPMPNTPIVPPPPINVTKVVVEQINQPEVPTVSTVVTEALINAIPNSAITGIKMTNEDKIAAEQYQTDKETDAQIDELIHQQEVNTQESNIDHAIPLISTCANTPNIIPNPKVNVPINALGQPMPPKQNSVSTNVEEKPTKKEPEASSVPNKKNIEALYN